MKKQMSYHAGAGPVRPNKVEAMPTLSRAGKGYMSSPGSGREAPSASGKQCGHPGNRGCRDQVVKGTARRPVLGPGGGRPQRVSEPMGRSGNITLRRWVAPGGS